MTPLRNVESNTLSELQKASLNRDLEHRVTLCWLEIKIKFYTSPQRSLQFYESPEFSNLPGSTNVCYAVYDVVQSVNMLKKAKKTGDKESTTDAIIRLVGLPFAFGNGVTNSLILGLSTKIVEVALVTEVVLTTLSYVTFIFGIILCFFEGVVETLGIIRQMDFENKWIKPIKALLEEKDPHKAFYALKQEIEHSSLMDNEIRDKIKLAETSIGEAFDEAFEKVKAAVLSKQLDNLWKSHFTLSDEELSDIKDSVSPDISKEKLSELVGGKFYRKQVSLARRVRPWLTEKFRIEVPEILKKIQNPNERSKGIERAKELLKNADIQNMKKILVHTVGIIALTITVIGLIVGVAGCPFLIPFIIMGIGFSLGFARYLLSKGLLDTEGWHFSCQKVIPDIFKKKEKVPKFVFRKYDFGAKPKTTAFQIPENLQRLTHARFLPK